MSTASVNGNGFGRNVIRVREVGGNLISKNRKVGYTKCIAGRKAAFHLNRKFWRWLEPEKKSDTVDMKAEDTVRVTPAPATLPVSYAPLASMPEQSGNSFSLKQLIISGLVALTILLGFIGILAIATSNKSSAGASNVAGNGNSEAVIVNDFSSDGLELSFLDEGTPLPGGMLMIRVIIKSNSDKVSEKFDIMLTEPSGKTHQLSNPINQVGLTGVCHTNALINPKDGIHFVSINNHKTGEIICRKNIVTE